MEQKFKFNEFREIKESDILLKYELGLFYTFAPLPVSSPS